MLRAPILFKILIVTLISVIMVFGFYWNEARKELKFLCSNFGTGVKDSIVIKQLNTGERLYF